MQHTINLFGIDLDSALQLTKSIASKHNARVKTSMHMGGWSAISTNSKEFADEVEMLFYPKATCKNPFEFAYLELLKQGAKITFAESCTGGLLSALFSQVAGFSSVFDGGLVTYSNHLKTQWLGVDPFVLETYGAVSSQCVEQMCIGAIARSDADISVAISGIAGPAGGSDEKPVGTVFIGVMKKGDKPYIEEFRFDGDRVQVQKKSACHALRMVLNSALVL